MEGNSAWKKSTLAMLKSCKSLTVFVEELVSDYILKARDPKLMESRVLGIINDILAHTTNEELKIKLKTVLSVIE